MMQKLLPSDSVRYVLLDKIGIILDLKTEDYFALDESASFFWRRLIDLEGDFESLRNETKLNSSAEAVSALASLDAFLLDCKKREFLTCKPQSLRLPKFGFFTRTNFNGFGFPGLGAVVALLQTSFMLKRKGFCATYLHYSQNLISSIQETRGKELNRLAKSFLFAENFVRLPDVPNDCLPRSLALFRFLRSNGVASVHRIGVQQFPAISIHAWVEVDGEPVLDSVNPGEFALIASIKD